MQRSTEEGSIAPLALLSLALTLTATLIVLCAGSLFQQQRTLNSLANAVALELAIQPVGESLKAHSALVALKSGKAHSAVVRFAVRNRDESVSVKLCQPARVQELMVPVVILGSAIGDVCVIARAGELLDAQFVE
jgi:hypothetical protein